MKVAVLGSTGMAGHMIAMYLQEKGYQIFRISRSERNTEFSRAVDVTKLEELSLCLDEFGCDIVINCIGLLQKSCEAHPDKAILINSYLPHFLEEKYKNSYVRVIHLSTDCVFSGAKGSYRDGDLPDGTTMYDRSKALGELINKKDLTFRMSIIGPDVDPKGTGLLNWFMQQQGTVYGYKYAIWNGVTTLELAEAIDHAIQDNLTGLYQLVPNKSICKYDLLLLFQKAFSKQDVNIEVNESFVLDKTLVNCRNDFDYVVKDYPEQVRLLGEWVRTHHSHYPEHYDTIEK